MNEDALNANVGHRLRTLRRSKNVKQANGERTDCNQRSAASYRFAFSFDEYTKKDWFFPPLVNSDLSERKRR